MPDNVTTSSIVLLGLTALGLAAACGFRVFVPLLIVAVGQRAGALELGGGWGWLGSTPALVVLGLATVLECAAFLVPFVDNALDLVATPAAVLAGAACAWLVTAEVEPWLRWSFAVIAGGGVAATVQVPTAAARALSSATSGGMLNAGLGLGETLGAGLVASMAVLAPIAIPLVLFTLLAAALGARRKRKQAVRGH